MSSIVQVVPLKGVLDSTQGRQLRQAVSDLVGAGHLYILVDCQALEFVDSSGLSALVMAYQKVRDASGILGLCAVNDQLRILLELTAMDDVFKVFSGVDAFSQSLASG